MFAEQPKAGTKVKPGTSVVLEVAKANVTSSSVPNVTGQTQQQAVSTLQQAGLKPSQPKGNVVAQHPAAGQKIAKGSAVLLNVSEGPG